LLQGLLESMSNNIADRFWQIAIHVVGSLSAADIIYAFGGRAAFAPWLIAKRQSMSGKFSGTATLPIPNSSTRRTAVVQQLESRTLLSAGAFDTSFGTNGTVSAGMNANGLYEAVAPLRNGESIVAIPTGLTMFDRHGKLDKSFGKDGFAQAPTELVSPLLAIQRDGKIVVTGGLGGSNLDAFRLLRNGKLDMTFGDHGVFSPPTSALQGVNAVAIQADGKIVLAGSTVKQRPNVFLGTYSEFAVSRLTRNGVLDPSFGTGGQAITDFGGTASSADTGAIANGVLILKDGRIIASGGLVGGSAFALARYDAHGKLDPTFGNSGMDVVHNFPASGPIVQQTDGKLLAHTSGGVARLTASGSLDPTFGVGGIASLSLPITSLFSPEIRSLALQKDGKIVGFGRADAPLVARWDSSGVQDSTFGNLGIAFAQTPFFPTGEAVNVGGFIQTTGDIVALSTSGLMAYTPGGQLDPKFGHRGVEWNTNGLTGQIDASALQKNGKIIVAGSELAVSPSAPTEAALARYNADGSLDRTFGDDGRAYVTLGDNANFDSLVIQSDGKIVAGGYGQVGATREFLVARLTPGGRLDRSFHHNGVLTSAFAGAASQSVAALAMGPGRTIVAAGSADQQIAVERILRNGNLDPSFATGGQFTAQPMGQASSGSGLIAGSDGRVTIGGTIGNNFGLIRLLPNGTFDPAFGTGGIVTTAFTDQFGSPTPSEANALTTDAKGDLILGGSTGGFGPDPLLPLGTLAVARYGSDGILDPTFGSGGKFTDASAGQFFLIDSLAVQQDGKILAGGLASGDAAVARLTDTGLDTTFSNLGLNPENGTSPTEGVAILGQHGFPGKPDDAPVTSVLVQPDGKIIAAHGTDLTRLTAT
jgi:uncharacterized delta-60 repeat protein